MKVPQRVEADDQIFDLVQLVYESAINAEVRAVFVYELCRLLDLSITHRHVIATNNAILDICHNDPDSVDCFFPGEEDPINLELPGGGSIQTISRLLEQADLIGNPFFGKWLMPPHEDRGAIVLLERCGDSYDFGLFYRITREKSSNRLQTILDILKPHCIAVAQLMRVTQRLELERQALIKALDQAPFGLMLVGADRKVIECNGSAQSILDNGLGLKLSKDQALMTSLKHEQFALEGLLVRAQQLAKNQTLEAAGAVTLARPGLGSKLEVVAWPAVQRHSSSLPGSSTVALFTRDPATQVDTDVPYEELKARYRLSKAEAVTFNLLRRGLSATEIASQLDVSVAAIQQRIRGILYKAKVSSVQDLFFT